MNRWSIAFFTILIVLSGEVRPAEETLGQQRLLNALRGRDLQATLVELDNVRTLRYQGTILPIVKAIWLGDAKGLDGVPKFMLEFDAVRITAAGVLVHAKRNGLMQFDTTSIASYSRELAMSGDRQVQHSALQVLGQLNNAEDIPLITEIGAKGNHYEFRSAAVALTLMCADEAGTALVALSKARESDSDRAYVAESLQTYKELRSLTCGRFK